MEEISCIFCGLLSQRVVIKENGYKGVVCDRCKLIYISPRPSAGEINELYSKEHAGMYADAQFGFERFKQMAARGTLRCIRAYRPKGSLLELGPGGGCFLNQAREDGYEPHGIELNPLEARYIKENLGIPCESIALSHGSFGGKQFDFVYHHDVLSHLWNPINVFLEIHRALKPDGLLVFETGNIADVDERYYKWFSQFLYPDHLFFFGEKSIGLLLERTGFKLLHMSREAILPELMLQKALWRMKDSLKDKHYSKGGVAARDIPPAPKSLTAKRKLRLLYRYVLYHLGRFGKVLPKAGRPLKLVVIAEKKCDKNSG
jgi:SAM-dependent methyltransferase